MPRLSIGLPIFNGEKFAARAIESLLTQAYKDFELIIADNCSSDGTGAICQRYAKSDARIRYVLNESNIGAAGNHNRVFELASGEYFKWAAHDDECFPEMLGRCVRALDESPADVVLVYPQSVIIDESSRVMEEYRKSIASEDAAPHRRLAAVLQNVELGTPMYGVMRSNALRKTRLIGGFQGSDYVLFAELAMLGRIREVPEMLFKKRFHPARSTELYKHDMARAYIQWLNPRAKQRPKLFAQKLPFEYVRSIWRMPLSLTDRLLCTAWTLAVFYRRENEGRAERWKQRFMRVLRQRSSDGSRHQKQLELRENL